MFRQFVAKETNNKEIIIDEDKARHLFRLHPSQLAFLLELAWDFRQWNKGSKTGTPKRRSDIPSLAGIVSNNDKNGVEPWITRLFPNGAQTFPLKHNTVSWSHLIYAYLIENTRVYEIMRRVLWEYRMGERLGVPTAEAQHWLRNTEELFYRDPAPFAINSVVSAIRPDSAAVRRNAYYRMFGMELNHGGEDNKPVDFYKPEAANRFFRRTFEEFLQEFWVAYTHQDNQTGVNATDDAAIGDRIFTMKNEFNGKRINGNLAIEEFAAVAKMSWFHLALEFDSPIVKSLRVESSTPKQRLFKIAERVKLPLHDKSHNFFILADPLSRILTDIESGDLNQDTVSQLYEEGGKYEPDMRLIVNHWSQATGRNMKLRSRPVTLNN